MNYLFRCYEENEFPYFLSMLSQRYGWVPTYDQVPEDIKHRLVDFTHEHSTVLYGARGYISYILVSNMVKTKTYIGMSTQKIQYIE